MRATIVLWSGLDPGGQAGLSADLQACARLDADVRVVLTARTAQADRAFAAAWPTEPDEIATILRGLQLPTQGVAVKTGMLATVANLRLCRQFCLERGLPLVVDPLHRSTSGGWLWPGEAPDAVRDALLHDLLPHAACVTPNWPELAWLAGQPLADLAAAEGALRALPCPAVLKGGHAPAPWLGIDHVWDGKTLAALPAERTWQGNVRGTGCRFATALAAGLAKGGTLVAAAKGAKKLVAGLAAR